MGKMMEEEEEEEEEPHHGAERSELMQPDPQPIKMKLPNSVPCIAE